jgi:Peptidase M61 N-terminal domain
VRRLTLIAVVLVLALPLLAVERKPISYIASFPAPQTHFVEIEAQIPTDGTPSVDLMMPVWTPGSYQVRDYSGDHLGSGPYSALIYFQQHPSTSSRNPPV